MQLPKIKKYHLMVSLLIVLAILPRAVELLSKNFIFEFDQGLFYQKVKQIVIDHKITLIGEEVGGSGGFFQGPGYYYLLSVFFWMWNGDPYGGMWLMFGTGILTVIVAWFVITKLFDKTVGLFGLFLFAVAPAFISQSRFIWNPFAVPIITLGILYFLAQVLKGNKSSTKWIFLCIGILYHFEIATGIMKTIEFCFVLLFLFSKRIIYWRQIFESFILLLCTQINLLIFDLRHDYLISKGIMRVFSGTQASLDFWNHVDVFRRSFVFSFPYGSQLMIIIMLMIFFGLWKISTDSKTSLFIKRFVTYLCISPIFSFFLYLFYKRAMWDWWLFDLSATYLVLSAIMFGYFYAKEKLYKFFVILVCSLFLYGHINDTYKFYVHDYPDYGGTKKIKGKIEALDFIYTDAKGHPFSLLVFTPPVYTYPYDYLLWWHARKTYGYLPNLEENILYLLIDKDDQKPWSYEGWITNVVKSGTLEQEWILPSGFIVQKRINK